MSQRTCWILIELTLISFKSANSYTKPNIILILADDLGVNDVSWNNVNSSTPNLHSLATTGTILDNAYTLPVCTPSRAALMSGIYPFKLGLQRGFGKHSPEGLPLNITLLPEHLQHEGYRTHGFGKWHLGFCSESYTPLKRGFDSYYGLFVGDDDEHTQVSQNIKVKKRENKVRVKRRQGREIIYFNKQNKNKNKGKHEYKSKKKGNQKKKKNNKSKVNVKENIKTKKKYNTKNKNNKKKGKQPNKINKIKNLIKRKKPTKEEKLRQKLLRTPTKFGSNIYGSKAIELIKSEKDAKPFFIYLALFTKSYPREVSNKRGNIEDAIQENRRNKLSDMDQTVKNIVDALKSSGQYSNTVIFFISDNGARATLNPDSANNPNYPLRGAKGTVYEGGTKVPAFIHSPHLKTTGTRYSGMFHMVDILPTLHYLASGQTIADIDGINQWEAVSRNGKSPRRTMIYNVDDNFVPAVLDGPGIKPKFQIAVREDNYKLVWGQPKMLHRSYREAKGNGGLVLDDQVLELYNLAKDPREKRNIALNRMDIVLGLKTLALNYYRKLIPPRFMGLQTTNQVLDAKSDFGGLSGWCRAVVSTTCGPLDENSFFRARGGGDMMELFYGTVPGVVDKRTFCVSSLE